MCRYGDAVTEEAEGCVEPGRDTPPPPEKLSVGAGL
jgi:hypothetical protein